MISACQDGYQLDNHGRCVPIGTVSDVEVYIDVGILAIAFVVALWLGT